MEYRGIYLGANDQIQTFTVKGTKSEKYDKMKIEGQTGDEIKTTFYIEEPYLGDNFPHEVVGMYLAATKKTFNLAKIRIISIDFPEQKFKYDRNSGQVIELMTDAEKAAQAEMGGATNEHKNTKVTE